MKNKKLRVPEIREVEVPSGPGPCRAQAAITPTAGINPAVGQSLGMGVAESSAIIAPLG